MHQETFVLNDTLSPLEVNKTIADNPYYQKCRSCLMQVYEPKCDRDFIESRMEIQRKTLPKANIVGMTTLGPIGSEIEVPQDTVITLVYFEESSFDVHLFDCNDIDPREAGMRLCNELAGVDNVQGILVLTACAMMDPTPFIDEVADRYPGISLFGAQAGTEELGNDRSTVFTSHEICDKGILAVVFYGSNLHIETDYNLGWRPVGREMTVTEMSDDGYVKTIDYNTAVTVYRKYLDVDLDDAFYSNVCAFPLLTPSGNRLIARVPTHFSQDGAMWFPAMLAEGSRVTLSYTKPEYLLRNTLASANKMGAFAPQAIMLFACINRRVYMGNERANREFEYYRRICPELSYAYGYGEILYTPEGGELLNSTIVVAAFREGDIPDGYRFEPFTDSELAEEGPKFKLLSDRLATFLEATTADFKETIVELEQMAQRDKLTGLYNRRWLDDAIEQRLNKRRRRNDRGFALLMYDIDFFKNVNDTYGHEMGDFVLKELGQRVRAMVRTDDAVGRWGGEEFLIIANHATIEDATRLAERIRKRIEETPFKTIGTITISFGVACAHEDDTPVSLFARVDDALYEAKHSGRNCVVAR